MRIAYVCPWSVRAADMEVHASGDIADLEHRIAILRQKAHRDHLELTIPEEVVRFIAENVPSSCRLLGYADPSSDYGADKQAGEYSWLETMQHALGFPILAAPSNEIGIRLDAVKQPLGTLIDGEPGFLLSPSCKVLRRGFNSKYCFVRVRGVNGDTYRDTPAKTDESHPHDALQYACLGTRGRYGVIHNDRPGAIGAPSRTVVPEMRVRL